MCNRTKTEKNKLMEIIVKAEFLDSANLLFQGDATTVRIVLVDPMMSNS